MTKSQGKETGMPLCELSQNLIFHAISRALKKWNVTSVLKAISRWSFISYWGGCFYSPSTVHITATIFIFICNKLSLLHETLNDTWGLVPETYFEMPCAWHSSYEHKSELALFTWRSDSVGLQSQDLPGWNMKLASIFGGRERLKKRQTTSDW